MSLNIKKQISLIKEKIKIQENDFLSLKHDLHKYLENNPLENIEKYNITMFDGLVLNGYQFNKYFKNLTLTKILNETECHNGYQFQTGLNIDDKNFDPISEYQGGIYFTNCPEKWSFLYDYGKEYMIPYYESVKTPITSIKPIKKYIILYSRPVTIPDEALVKIFKHKFKSNMIILGERSLYKE
jgi:hypothetical protein